MPIIKKSYRILKLLVDINWDRMLSFAVLAVSLLVGAYFGMQLLEQQF